jgi:hypothetical protein
MPRVPGITQVRRAAGRRRHTVTGAAQIVDLSAGQSRRFRRMELLRIASVVGRGSMADFAADAQLVGNNRVVSADADGSGRVTGETAHDRGGRVVDAIADTGGVLMPRRQGHAVQTAIPAFAQFQVIIRIGPADKRDRLRSRPERPFAGLRRLRLLQRMSMSTLRLRCVLLGMTPAARRRARVIGSGRDGKSQQSGDESNQKMNFPEN